MTLTAVLFTGGLGIGAFRYVCSGGSIWRFCVLGQFLANFSVLTSCVESSQILRPFM